MLAGELHPRPRGVSSQRGMPSRSRVLTKDEELGKRDDDFRPASSRASAMSILFPWQWRKRRVLLIIVLVGIVYLLVQTVPTNITPGNGEHLQAPEVHEPRNRFHSHPPASKQEEEHEGAPPREHGNLEIESAKHYYNGPVKFYRLGQSLQNIQMTMGNMENNRNILFAASSLRSLANLLPMACDMAKQELALPHFVLFGRSTLTMDELLEINGVNRTICNVYFHDARPDFAEFSSDDRAAISVAGGMIHIYSYMHPQAMIVDDKSTENEFFTSAMTRKASETGRPLIEIPKGRYEDFLWMTRLDAGSLSNWYKPTIDIVIQAPSKSAGSLLRLLKSLSSANYDAMPIPRLTIELPANPEAFVVGYLARMKWPPIDTDFQLPNMLTVHHRIPSSRFSQEQASLRFLESFYPNDPNSHHVLLLSPQAEVSPLYMQYLLFSVLKYRHATYIAPAYEGIVGLSLDTRASLLNGSTFDPPVVANMTFWNHQQDDTLKSDAPVPYLYAAPASGATLIYGDKWVCLHTFLEYRMASSFLGKAAKVKKIVAETEPAWMEYLTELMRARGWSMIYPASSYVTLHNEMAQVPEEFLRQPNETSEAGGTSSAGSDRSSDDAFLIADVPPVLEKHEEKHSKEYGPLHKLLPYKQNMPETYEMPYYAIGGEILGNVDVPVHAKEFATYFKTTVGGCTSKEAEQTRQVAWLDARDLFCLPGLETQLEDDRDETTQDWLNFESQNADEEIDGTLSPQIQASDTTDAGIQPSQDELEEDVNVGTT